MKTLFRKSYLINLLFVLALSFSIPSIAREGKRISTEWVKIENKSKHVNFYSKALANPTDINSNAEFEMRIAFSLTDFQTHFLSNENKRLGILLFFFYRVQFSSEDDILLE
jgi:hypothetical protein